MVGPRILSMCRCVLVENRSFCSDSAKSAEIQRHRATYNDYIMYKRLAAVKVGEVTARDLTPWDLYLIVFGQVLVRFGLVSENGLTVVLSSGILKIIPENTSKKTTLFESLNNGTP